LKKLKDDSESQAIQKSSEKLAKDIGNLLVQKSVVPNDASVPKDDGRSYASTESYSKNSGASKKKKRQKSKKKKRK